MLLSFFFLSFSDFFLRKSDFLINFANVNKTFFFMYKLFFCTSCEQDEIFRSTSFQEILVKMWEETRDESFPLNYSDDDWSKLCWLSVWEWFEEEEEREPELLCESPKFYW